MANLRVAESGKTITLAAGFDMSLKDTVSVTLTAPDATTVTVEDARITIPGIQYVSPTLGTLAANEYLTFDTATTDFAQAGTYTAYITYNDTSETDVHYSDIASITVTAVGA